MAITTALKVNQKVAQKENKDTLDKSIISLKKRMKVYKVRRKADWKLFKNKFNEDLDKIEKSLKELTPCKKKK